VAVGDAATAGPRLVAQPNEPIRVTQELKPIRLTEPKPGVFVFDLGQNMVGWCRLAVRGKPGATVRLRHAEMLDEAGLEVFYDFQLTQWCHVGADLQVIRPGLGESTAVLPGLRAVIRL